jgi:hypothetical protein
MEDLKKLNIEFKQYLEGISENLQKILFICLKEKIYSIWELKIHLILRRSILNTNMNT